MTKRVAIVGGGIAGLTLAAVLDVHRFEVTVHEAQPERSSTGSALGLWQPAERVLRSIDAFAESGSQRAAGTLHRMDGRRIATARGGGPVLVDRPALLAALESAVPATVRRVTEEVTDPAALDADLVIGADGVRSRVRGLIAPHANERVATPYLALRGIRDGATQLADAGEYWGRGLIAGVVTISGDRSYWFTTHRSALTEPLDMPQVLDEARERFRGAAPLVRRVLAEAGPDTIATALWVAPPLQRYVRGRYVVIGDAAHGMLPNLGRGACSAIVDAATLARALNAGADLRRWQARRLPATQLARVASAAVMRVALAIP